MLILSPNPQIKLIKTSQRVYEYRQKGSRGVVHVDIWLASHTSSILSFICFAMALIGN